jgi:lyso-ornithine lipid O-acyltransferase
LTLVRSASRIAQFTAITFDAIARAHLADDDLVQRAARLHATCKAIAQSHGLRIQVRGALPRGPVVLVSNHVSYLDAIALAALTPCAPIAKSEVAAWPMIGTAAAQLGVTFVERESMWSRVCALRTSLAALRAGVSVMNFPEGTTTDGTKLLAFQRGCFGLARLAGVRVVPIAVRCAPALAWFGAAPFVPHYLAMTRLAAPEIRLEIGHPIDPTRYASDQDVAALARNRIAYLMRPCLPEDEETHAPIIRPRLPAPRPDPVLPLAQRARAR